MFVRRIRRRLKGSEVGYLEALYRWVAKEFRGRGVNFI
jgi:hypothetical protein